MKYQFAVLALVVAIPQLGYALPGFSEAVNHITPQSWNAQPKGCTSFEGTWKGSCTAGSVKTPEETQVIKQTGCEAIQTGHDFQPIGGLSSTSITLPQADGSVFGVSAVGALDWNADKTSLALRFNGLGRKIGNNQLIDMNGTGSMQIDGNRLLVDLTLMGTKVSCVYDRQ